MSAKYYCEICGAELVKLNNLIPDLFIDLNDDGKKQPVCRNCAFGILLFRNKSDKNGC